MLTRRKLMLVCEEAYANSEEAYASLENGFLSIVVTSFCVQRV